MFSQPREKGRETWDGIITGPERVVEGFGINEAFPHLKFERLLLLLILFIIINIVYYYLFIVVIIFIPILLFSPHHCDKKQF